MHRSRAVCPWNAISTVASEQKPLDTVVEEMSLKNVHNRFTRECKFYMRLMVTCVTLDSVWISITIYRRSATGTN